MIRILHVVASLNINAGMMSVVMNYFRNIDRNKVVFDFLYFEKTDKTHQKEIEDLGGRVFYVPHRTFKLKDQKALFNFFHEHKGEFTAVHCHPIWSSFVVSRAAKRSGIRHVIQHVHSTRYSEKPSSEKRNRLLMKFVQWFSTDYIACNNEARYLFGKKLVESGKVAVIPNAIDPRKYQFDMSSRRCIRDEFHISENTSVIGTVGRLSIEKNQLFIIDMFYELIKILPDTKLLIVGEGDMRQSIEQRISEYGLIDDVILTGRRRDIREMLSSFDLFLMPSVFEGTPVSVLEARSSGLPCMLSDSITKSVSMPGVYYFKLDAGPSKWAKEAKNILENTSQMNRYDYIEVVNHGFDISVESNKLQDYYLELR